MKRTRRIEIRVEREEILVVRKPANRVMGRCADCGEDVHMFTPEEAMAVTATSLQEVMRRVESGEVHSAETADGGMLICINSLLA